MTGTQPKEIQSISEGKKAHEFLEENAPRFPELFHNLNLLVYITEEKILDVHRKMAIEKSNLKRLDGTLEELKGLVGSNTRMLQQRQALTEEFREIIQLSKTNRNLPFLRERFQIMFKTYKGEEATIVSFIMSIISKLWRQKINSWDILVDPTGLDLESLKYFKHDGWLKINPEKMVEKERNMTPYESLIYTFWLPKVRQTVLNIDIRKEKIIEFLEMWKPVIPEHIFEVLLFDQILVPKLFQIIEDWDYKNEIIPIHTFILSWIPLLGERLSPLYIHLRQKLYKLLEEWHPSDSFGVKLVKPWKAIFSESDMATIVNKAVLPKLIAVLKDEFQVNPAKQDMEPLTWVFRWKSFMPVERFSVEILEKVFFPKWLKALYVWLTSNPNYEHVIAWYSQWKDRFPADIRDLPNIKHQFTKGLDMMNQLTASKLPFEAFKPNEVYNATQLQAPEPVNRKLTFKEVIERVAADNHVEFISLGRTNPRNNKPLYRFGKYLVWLQNDLMYLYSEGKDDPKSIDDLIKMNKAL
jgi:tuftelin-interacting protein 11